MHLNQLSDEELVSQFRSGCGESPIDALFRRHHGRVALWCLRFTGDRESAADLAQEIFVTAWRRMDSFRGDAKFSTWLYAIARNHCLNHIRSLAARPDSGAGELSPNTPSSEEDALARLEREEALRLMRELISTSLDETERRVVALHYGEGMPIDSITRLLGLANASGAKACIVSARRKLGRAMEQINGRRCCGTA
jgi:RNA polymerase sigma-70 factor (ECF subfamily)